MPGLLRMDTRYSRAYLVVRPFPFWASRLTNFRLDSLNDTYMHLHFALSRSHLLNEVTAVWFAVYRLSFPLLDV